MHRSTLSRRLLQRNDLRSTALNPVIEHVEARYRLAGDRTAQCRGASSGNARMAKKNSAAPQASIRWGHETGAAGVSTASCAGLASVMEMRQTVG
jgi:hypothetical protein